LYLLKKGSYHFIGQLPFAFCPKVIRRRKLIAAIAALVFKIKNCVTVSVDDKGTPQPVF
jgi:hypothetical protein